MSSGDFKELKKELRRLDQRRSELLEIFYSREILVPGSHMEVRIRCGTEGCHCHQDGGHPSVRISRWVDGKLKSRIVRLEDREWIAEAAQSYRAHKQAMTGIAKINSREKEVLKKMIELKSQIYV